MLSFDNLLQVHKSVTILVPNSIVTLLNTILHSLHDKGSEYGIYLKGSLDKHTMTMTISSEYLIPRQSVTSVTIDFQDPPPSNDWNVVLHRHPDGVTRFSGTDDTSINKEFDASLLFIPPFSFPQAIYNYDVGDGVLIQMPARVVQIADDGQPVDVSMITQKRHNYVGETPVRKQRGLGLKLQRKTIKRTDDKLEPGEGAFAEFGNVDDEAITALEQEMELEAELELNGMHDDILVDEDEDLAEDNPLFAHLSGRTDQGN